MRAVLRAEFHRHADVLPHLRIFIALLLRGRIIAALIVSIEAAAMLEIYAAAFEI